MHSTPEPKKLDFPANSSTSSLARLFQCYANYETELKLRHESLYPVGVHGSCLKVEPISVITKQTERFDKRTFEKLESVNSMVYAVLQRTLALHVPETDNEMRREMVELLTMVSNLVQNQAKNVATGQRGNYWNP